MPGVSLVTVATFANAMEASLAKGFLEAAGIPAFLAAADDAEEAAELLGMAEEREN